MLKVPSRLTSTMCGLHGDQLSWRNIKEPGRNEGGAYYACTRLKYSYDYTIKVTVYLPIAEDIDFLSLFKWLCGFCKMDDKAKSH